MIDDAQIIAEAIKLVGEGVSVTFPVAGRSMRPFIVGNLVGVEHCKVPDVKAIATHAVNARGKRRSFANPLRRAAAWVWIRLRPVRKWLLLAYRVYEKVFYEN